jgi:hypothetical protein
VLTATKKRNSPYRKEKKSGQHKQINQSAPMAQTFAIVLEKSFLEKRKTKQ